MQKSYKFSLFSVSHINLHELNRMFVPNQVEIEIIADNLKYFVHQSGIHRIWSHESRFFSRFEISFLSWVKNLQRSVFSDLFVFLILIFHSAYFEPKKNMLHIALFCNIWHILNDLFYVDFRWPSWACKPLTSPTCQPTT